MTIRKLTPAVIAVPGIVVTIYASCNLASQSTTLSGTGYGVSCTDFDSWRQTEAWYMRPAQADTITFAADSDKHCGTGEWSWYNELEEPIMTTAMGRTNSGVPWVQEQVQSWVDGNNGIASARWLSSS